MLMDRWGSLDLRTALKTGADFEPFPRAGDREGWARILPATRQAWTDMAARYAEYAWPALPVRLHIHFQRTGENLPYLHAFWERRSVLGVLALAECLEGRGRYLTQIASGVYAICEETTWMTPFDLASLGQVMPAKDDTVVNLATSETGALLAWVRSLLKKQLDAISPRICARINDEIRTRLVQPYHDHDDYWWMGFVETPRVNNWNPWCNRNMLMCLLLLDLDEELRASCIRKAMRSLDAYLARYPPDGCCDEGPMYWGAAGGGLHTCLELLSRASSGAIDIFDEPIVRDIGRYLAAVHIHDEWFVDFADGDARVKPGAAAFAYGRSIRDDDLVKLGASGSPARPVVLNWFGAFEYLADMFGEEEREAARSAPPYPRDAWMWHTQVMTAREEGGTHRGLFLAAKAGNNGESHNHNDVGSFIVYADGNPVLVDLGTEEYTAKTFGPQRFELWYLQSQYHNCPTIRGVMQHDGPAYAARDVTHRADDLHAEMTADIRGAYPVEAGLAYWRRTCRLNRGASPSVEVIDEYRFAASPAGVAWNLVTPCTVRVVRPGTIELGHTGGGTVVLHYDPALEARVEPTPVLESRLRKNWGDVMFRVVLAEASGPMQATRTMTIGRE
jgi:hypothetical protein